MDGEKITFGEFAEKWLVDYAEKQLAAKTVFDYKNELTKRILPAIGHIRLSKIKPNHLIDFYNNLSEDGMRLDTKYVLKPEYQEILSKERKKIQTVCDTTLRSVMKGNATTLNVAKRINDHCNIPLTEMFELKKSKNKLTGKTINNYHKLISSILSSAVQWQLILSNPCDRVTPPKIEKKEAKHYDDGIAKNMFAILENAPIRYQVAIYIAVFGGLRLGEIASLEWTDIDFNENILKIDKAVQYISGIGNFDKVPKTEKSKREIALPEIVMNKLRIHQKEQKEFQVQIGESWEHHNKIFTQKNGRPIFHDTLSKWFSKWQKTNGLPKLKFHELRHTSASLLIAEGVDIATVSKRLGHSNVLTTAGVYTHAIDRKDKEAAKKLEQLFTVEDKRL